MDPRRRTQLLAGAVVVVATLVAYRMYGGTSVDPRPASNPRNPVTTTRSAPQPTTAPDVHLEALERETAEPTAAARDLFRFKPKPPPPAPPAPPRPAAPLTPAVNGPPPPPPLPAIPLKFLGTISQGGKTVAVLSDGVGSPAYGSEGAIVLGRYKILRIGVESIDMSYVDGRGRQTIRLSGS